MEEEWTEPAVHSGLGQKKNTKRWCKGKVGREHDLKHVMLRDYGITKTWADVCQNCNKKLNLRFSKWNWKEVR